MVVGIAGVVGVLVSVLAMSEGFRHTLASTGRPDRVILLRAGSDAELSSGVPRDAAVLLSTYPVGARAIPTTFPSAESSRQPSPSGTSSRSWRGGRSSAASGR